MRRVLLLAAYPAFIALVVVAIALANGALDPNDASHAVVIRNEALVPFVVRLLGRSGDAAFYEIPPASEATLTPHSATSSLHEVVVLDADCVATGMMGFGGGGPANHWSDLAMLVIQADGSLGGLLPGDLAAWNQSRQTLPAAAPRSVAGCEEQ